MEKMYQLSSGKIFKYDEDKMLFYSLGRDGQWILDSKMMDIYFDAASDYMPIESGDIEISNGNLDEIEMEYATLESGTSIKYNNDEKVYYYQDEDGNWIEYPPLESVVNAENTHGGRIK